MDRLLRFFEYGHLPPNLQEVSKPFAELANRLATSLNSQMAPSDASKAEMTVALRKLLEAKDCAVRAML